MPTWIKIGVRNLFKNKRRSLFTIGAIALGFAAVNLFGGFTAYVFKGLEDSFVYAMGNGHLAVFKQGFLKEGLIHPTRYLLSEQDLARLRELCAQDPRIDRVTPQLNISGLLSNGKVSTIMIAEGRVAEDVRYIRDKGRGFVGKIKLFDGDELDDGKPSRVGVSKGLAEKLHLKRGSDAIVMATTVDGQMNAMDVSMVQDLDAAIEVLDNMLMSVPLSFAQQLYDTKSVDRLTILLRDPRDTRAMRRELERRFREAGLAVELRTWEELRVSYLKIRNMFNVMFSLLFIIVFVIVVLSVINTVSMAVMERTREIGTLRSLGLKRRGIVTMFATESALLGVAGSALGLALTAAGWLAVRLAQPTWIPPNIPKRVPLEVYLVPDYLLASLVFLVALAVLAAVIPARRAARLSIIDALGHV